MSESKHTPGPWRTGMEHGTIVAGWTGGRGYVVAEGVTKPSDAALIARAPDLLREVEELKAQNAELLGALVDVRGAWLMEVGSRGVMKEHFHVMDSASALITKAKGGAE